MKITKEKVITTTLLTILFAIINVCGLVILITSFMTGESGQSYNKLINDLVIMGMIDKNVAEALLQGVNLDSVFEEYDLKIKAGLILGEVIGAVLSLGGISKLISIKSSSNNNEKLINAIVSKEDKRKDKDEREVKKFLG